MLCACALAAATVLSAFAEECVALRPGEVEVVLPEKPFPAERFAAQELTNFLSRVLGAKVPIATAPAQDGVSVFLGDSEWTRAAGIDAPATGQDAYRIRAEGNKVFITLAFERKDAE